MPRIPTSSNDTREFLDTGVLARYLVGDTPYLAARVSALIDSARPLCVSLVVSAELGYVLTRLCHVR
jgi:predicted nucleic acid-binding protein